MKLLKVGMLVAAVAASALSLNVHGSTVSVDGVPNLATPSVCYDGAPNAVKPCVPRQDRCRSGVWLPDCINLCGEWSPEPIGGCGPRIPPEPRPRDGYPFDVQR